MFSLKKAIASMAVGAVLMIPVSAEAPAVHDLTDDELKALYIDVKQELMDRGIWDGATLPSGVYVGGEDLPIGSYACEAKGYMYIRIYKNYDAFLNDESMLQQIIVNDGEQFSLKLTENVCWFVSGNATVRPMVGLEW